MEPTDHQGAIHGECPVNVGRRHAGAAGADGQPGAPQVLALDRQESLDHRQGIPGRRSAQQLGPEALAAHPGQGGGLRSGGVRWPIG